MFRQVHAYTLLAYVALGISSEQTEAKYESQLLYERVDAFICGKKLSEFNYKTKTSEYQHFLQKTYFALNRN